MQAGLHFLERLVPVDSLFHGRRRAVTVLVFDVSFSQSHFVPFDSSFLFYRFRHFSHQRMLRYVLAMVVASSRGPVPF